MDKGNNSGGGEGGSMGTVCHGLSPGLLQKSPLGEWTSVMKRWVYTYGHQYRLLFILYTDN